ncbi:hypothetical protein FND50_32775 [Rhodococcus sp. WB9]|uniref:hypothetical protein n=1 Tax=Rhodococcus sp. WB9 TaxID=2594007 RepID=UPI0011848A99|nr:hypothetical protein [Rhodococcus sp. WB9]QDQ95090.1 hypothetical protein FND50_32775 [Rhodococcus sp. WB9]
MVRRIVPGGPDEHALSVPFDIWGALLVGAGLACLLVTVGEGGRWGWTSPWTVGFSVGAAILLASWELLDLRTDHPLINLRALHDTDVLLANGTAAGLGAALTLDRLPARRCPSR